MNSRNMKANSHILLSKPFYEGGKIWLIERIGIPTHGMRNYTW
jgi:hypothetical protein